MINLQKTEMCSSFWPPPPDRSTYKSPQGLHVIKVTKVEDNLQSFIDIPVVFYELILMTDSG